MPMTFPHHRCPDSISEITAEKAIHHLPLPSPWWRDFVHRRPRAAASPSSPISSSGGMRSARLFLSIRIHQCASKQEKNFFQQLALVAKQNLFLLEGHAYKMQKSCCLLDHCACVNTWQSYFCRSVLAI
nr:uncharacterized protein LOC107281835 isoform X3 [Oryza sativa Japonica Group]